MAPAAFITGGAFVVGGTGDVFYLCLGAFALLAMGPAVVRVLPKANRG
jgi:hypothetical protein